MIRPPSNRPISPAIGDIRDRDVFARTLDDLAAQTGLSLREFAAACSAEGHTITHGTIGYWLKGQALPSNQNEQAFRIFLGLLGVIDKDDQDTMVDAAQRLRRRASRPSAEPYRGLDSYDVDDAREFFGRSALIGRIVTDIDALLHDGGGAMLLTGASGAGKTSLLKAGVMSTRAAGAVYHGSGEHTLYISAESDPPVALAQALAHCAGLDASDITAMINDGPDAVARLVDRVVTPHALSTADATEPTDDAGRSPAMVVIVDQFEQVLLGDDDAAEAFISALHGLTRATTPVAVVLGVRLDFMDEAMQRRSVQDLTTRPPIFVDPMDDDDLVQVITQPARNHGVRLDPGFVELLLRDISARGGRAAHQAGILPLLSYALRMTWQRGGGKRMTVADYRAVGGIDGAVRDSAERVYSNLPPHQQDTARRMFLSLVHVNPSGAETRRQIPLDDLFGELDGCPAELSPILDQFVAQRLLTIDEDTVEITHEALMVAWPLLRGWLDTDRSGRRTAQQLATDAREWDSSGRRQPDLLYRGNRLLVARDWCTSHPTETTSIARAFLDASLRRTRRQTRRLRLIAAVLTLLTIVSSALAVRTYDQNNALQQQRDDAQSRTLAHVAASLRDKDVTLARQLALTAYRISPTTEARSALVDATAMRPAVRILNGGSIMYAVAMHPAGRIAAAATETTVRFWDITNPDHPTARPGLPDASCDKVFGLAFSPDGNLLAASCAGGTIHLWDTHNPTAPVALPTLTGLGLTVYSVAFSQDGTTMAAAIAEAAVNGVLPGSIRMWSLHAGHPQPLGGPLRVDDTAAAKSVAFRSDNKTLAVGTDDGSVQLWDISDPAHPTHPVAASGVTKSIGQLAFSPDGNTLAAGSTDFTVHLWSTTDPRSPISASPPIAGASTWVNALAFSPDGATLAIASSDERNGLRLVDVANQRVIATMPHPAPVTAVAFSADGNRVITGANDGVARLWPVAGPTLEGMTYAVSATEFSPDGTRLAVGSSDLRILDTSNPLQPKQLGPAHTNPDGFSGTLAYSANGRLLAEGRGRSGTLQLWDVAHRAQPTPLGPPLQADPQAIETLTFNPTSTLLAVGSNDDTVRLWDVTTPQSPVLLSIPGTFASYVYEVAFSPNGTLLAAGSIDKTVRLWDITNPRKPVQVGPTLTPGNHYVYSALFSPDGKILAVSLADSTVRLYDVTDPRHVRTIGKPLTGPDNYIYDLAFSTDGTTLAAAATDDTVWLWNVHQPATPTVQATLTLPTSAVYTLDFQPHTSVLAAGGAEQRAWLWTTDPTAAAAVICRTSGDPITPTEWAKYVPDRDYTPPCD